MLVSEVIGKLEAYQNKFGDIEVNISDEEIGYKYRHHIDEILANDKSITIYQEENYFIETD